MSKVSTGALNFQNSTNLVGHLAEFPVLNGHTEIVSSKPTPNAAWVTPSQSQGNTNELYSVEAPASKKLTKVKRTPGEIECTKETRARLLSITFSLFSYSFSCSLISRLAHDQSMVLHPEVDSPFVDQLDVIRRLLPYHLFQHPKDDLDAITTGKGKEKAVEQDWREEIRGTKEQFNRRFYCLCIMQPQDWPWIFTKDTMLSGTDGEDLIFAQGR
jgi:hypothetical protein